jgi:Heat induced stress protein YflT
MAPRKKKIETQTDGGTVVGMFGAQPSAERAIQSLKAAGFSEQQIGVAVRDRTQQEAMTEATGTQAAEGAATGAMSGGVVGGVIGLLAGVGALAIPGIGPVIAGGALASTLAGAGIGAAAGGLLGALVGMGIPEEDARHFERGFQEGGVLVTVQAGSRSTEARQILYESEADLGSMGRSLTTGDAGRNNLHSGQRDLAQPDEFAPEDTRGDSETWRGSERRYHDDQNYLGPNRRMVKR